MYELKITSHFSAAHSLRNYQGKCENTHGHNWKVELVLRAPELREGGMVMDFSEMRERLEGVLEGFDHKSLNDIKPFDKINPTTENIACEIYRRLAEDMPDDLKVASVSAYETDSSGATYFEE
jgi:6-pyruvoyltetrahydropterin/6-carboxytetrahydropterin synthase